MDRVAKTYISSMRFLGRLVVLCYTRDSRCGRLRIRRGIWTSQARVDALQREQIRPCSALVEQSVQDDKMKKVIHFQDFRISLIRICFEFWISDFEFPFRSAVAVGLLRNTGAGGCSPDEYGLRRPRVFPEVRGSSCCKLCRRQHHANRSSR
jgi:hypothetical protein